MQAPDILSPPLAQALRNGPYDFLHQSGTCNSHLAPGLHQPGEVAQVQVVCPVIKERIDAHDGIEEFCGKRKRPRIRMDREYAVFDPGIADPSDVLRGTEP